MQCPLCRQRPARRSCPALGRQICAVCCGTKRGTEISCPAGCAYLATARAHPPATEKKQHERDLLFAGSLMSGLRGEQQELTWAVLGFVTRFAVDPLLRLRDEDVADMASSLAATLQTAARGVIYEHRPRSSAAQRLSTELRAFLDQSGLRQADRRFDQNLAATLERIATSFREGARLTGDASPTACLAAAGRILRAAEASVPAQAERQAAPAKAAPPPSPLILP